MVYPNPIAVSGNLTIQRAGFESSAVVSIGSVNGKSMYNNAVVFENGKFELKLSYQVGLYFVEVNFGDRVEVFKLRVD